MRRPVLSQNFPNYSPPMPPVLNTGNSNSVIQQNIDSLKITNPEIYEKYKNDPKTLVYMANSFLEVAKDPEMTALEELEAPRKYDMLKTAFTDANRVSVVDQQAKDALDFGEDYALDQRAKSLAAVSRAQKDPTTTLFDDGNKVPSAYTEPVLYNSPEENMGLGNLDKVEEPPLLADFTSPMPTGARLDPYMDIPTGVPDSVMKGALEDPYDETPPVLKEALQDPYDETPPALTGSGNKGAQGGSSETNTNTGVLGKKFTTTASEDRMSSPVTANARGSAMPDGKIGRNEMLMRMGARMMAGSTQGYGAAMDAAFTEMGAMQDSNRQAEMDAFNKAEATRLAEERIQLLRDKSDAKNAKTPNTAALQYGQAALSAIDRIESLVNAEQKWVPWDNTTGLIGNLMKSVPASAANDVLANIKTIEAAVGFDRLQAMRDASPTGGALGQVSNIELDLLKSSLGNLNQSQSKEQFMLNLKQVQKVYNEIVHGKGDGSQKPSGSNDSEYTDDEMKYLNS